MDPMVTDDARALSPWNTAEVGYFYPDTDSFNHIVTEENHIMIFHNAEAFVSHLRGIAVFKTEAVVRANVHSCLRQVALEWYITELTDTEREYLRSLPLEQGWFKQILSRFNLSSKIARFRYETANFHNRNPFRMAYNLVRDAQAAGIYDSDEHLCQIWRCLDTSASNLCYWEQSGFKGLVLRPLPGDCLSNFHRELNHQMMDFAINKYFYDTFLEEDPDIFREWCQNAERWSDVVLRYSTQGSSFLGAARLSTEFGFES
ncbi:hypothetical protein N7493_003134 [Penicillium malachiteum]|uniref:Uncharacterized protein n=1 Tax=Penicillium malachiteum TaxID=1324776 RepID=A0AAD6HT62_9EURO|nr:hypothetical protein N7493_003134 [Penicillium malachiteum]